MYQWTPYADTLLKNGRIYTVDTTLEKIKAGDYSFPIVENGYIAMKDGKIIGVGEGDGECFAGEATNVVDLEGKSVIPGLIDSHMHATEAGVALKAIGCAKCTGLKEMLGLIEARAASEAVSDSWLKAAAFNELSWKDGLKPDAKILDEVTGEHPLIAARLCGHVIVANSKAMEIAGITKDSKDPEGGTIGRYEDGTPNGWFYEPAAMELVAKYYPKATEKDYVEAISDIGAYMNSVGLTAAIDCNLDFIQSRAYSTAKKENKLSYRANLSFYMDKAVGDVPYHINRLYETLATTGFGDDMLKFNGVKILFDGIPASGTAYMRKNYKHMPETRGFTTITGEELAKICRAAANCGWQVAVHAIGDAAMDLTLEAFKAGAAVTDTAKNRNYIIHAVFPREDMLPKMKELDVAVTIQPTIMGIMGEEAVLDDADKAINQPAGFYFDNGIICGGGTDCPVVDCNPFVGMGKAVSRRCLDGEVHGPEYCVTPAQALIMWTMNSAYFIFGEEKVGSIAPGKLADVVVIDTPILEASAEEIERTKVIRTYLGGELVYQAR